MVNFLLFCNFRGIINFKKVGLCFLLLEVVYISEIKVYYNLLIIYNLKMKIVIVGCYGNVFYFSLEEFIVIYDLFCKEVIGKNCRIFNFFSVFVIYYFVFLYRKVVLNKLGFVFYN